MALNYAEQWSPELLEILMQGTLTSPFVTSNVRWLDAKTFHFTQMSTSGYKNHSREGGWNKGTYTQTDVPYTLTHDRDVEFISVSNANWSSCNVIVKGISMSGASAIIFTERNISSSEKLTINSFWMES